MPISLRRVRSGSTVKTISEGKYVSTENKLSKGGRGLRFAALAAVVAVAFAAIAGAGFAHDGKKKKHSHAPAPSAALAQYQYGKKVMICHKGRQTLLVSVNSWKGHSRHGDVLGPCVTQKAKPRHGDHARGGDDDRGKVSAGSSKTSGSSLNGGSSKGKGEGKNEGKNEGKGKGKGH